MTKPRKKNATPKPAKPPAGVKNVAVWEDDPGPHNPSTLTPVDVAAPNQAAKPYPYKISGTTPPAAVYATGTAHFRFYATAAALRRTADFWAKVVPAGTKWQVGKTLPVALDSGVDLNAFYTRGDGQDTPGLHFFHATVAGHTYFSCESPDVCCHEMGHAVLDSIRPQLFDAQTIEAAAFHEGFADVAAILSDLQVPSFRAAVLAETGGTLNRTSRLSRLAEQLGAAIRIQHPDAVDPDSLRNAANSFFYRDPQTLPPSAPASTLSSEPHSFSRVFSGAFLDILSAMFKLQNATPTADDLVKATLDAARVLVNAILAAPVVPDYYSQIAAHMVTASQTAPFDGKYTAAIKSAFVRRGILSLQAATTLSSINVRNLPKAAVTAATISKAPASLPKASISAAAYGLSRASLVVHTAEDAKRFGVTSAALGVLGSLEPRSPQNAAESYTEDLFQRGRVSVGEHANATTGALHSMAFTTHIVVEENGELVLKRRAFECGLTFD
ncbi:MAG: hypothetical protein ABI693_28355 [Bryobacteraceae bacterium]